MMKLEKLTVTLENPDEEIQKFKSHIEYLSQNDQTWPTWQDITCFNDHQFRCRYCDDKSNCHKLHSKVTDTKGQRHQPDEDRARMKLCNQIPWGYDKFMN
jgi:hypothetical protein